MVSSSVVLPAGSASATPAETDREMSAQSATGEIRRVKAILLGSPVQPFKPTVLANGAPRYYGGRMTRTVLVALALTLVLAPAAQAADPLVVAHRGGSLVNGAPRYPENTLAAFQAAVDFKAVLELDSRITKDGKV